MSTVAVAPVPVRAAPLRQRRVLLALALWIVPLLVFVNAALYIAYAANPLVMADAWYFIHAFLIKNYEHGVSLIDLYVKRGGDDHAQPLQKLLLLANAKWFGLDFVFEALVGLAMAIATYCVVLHSLLPDHRSNGNPAWFLLLSSATLAALMVSLNAGMVFNWSLVALGYLPHMMAALAATACWRAMTGRGDRAFLAMSIVIAFTLDSMALITAASLACIVLLAALRGFVGRGRALRLLLYIVLPLLLYLLISRTYLHVGVPAGPHADIPAFVQVLRQSAGEMLVIVLGSSLAHAMQLQILFPHAADTAQAVIAVLVLLGHVWFWWRVLRGRWNASTVIALCMMLMFYASLAGIMLSRIPQYGVGYLHQPRYVLTYQFGTLALLLLLAGHALPVRRGWRVLATAALALVLMLQVPLSRHSWDEGRYIQGYIHTMARQMYLAGLAPDQELRECVAMLNICHAAASEREQSLGFLMRHQLNVFSPRLRARYSLQNTVTPPPRRLELPAPEAQ